MLFGSAAAAAILVTFFELYERSQAHAFSRSRWRGLTSAVMVALLDGLVAALVATGFVLPAAMAIPSGAKGLIYGVLCGVLGPLALRSPVRKVEKGDAVESVGITYVYDRARGRLLYSYDERMAWSIRREVAALRQSLVSRGVTPHQFASEIIEHSAHHAGLTEELRAEIRTGVERSLRLRTDELRLDSLLKLARERRFVSLLRS
ncbi:hypothetical protein [Cellulosimicrobium sp. SL-1]|uniref:hypothetical protein n=1 Tax=Cellulosimicrobium sp. SL-1 TaxID=2699423 RepID=UPI0013D34638|nr:hypothetical protein [Cellulosimicrobium sp. SL-1]